MKKRNRNVTSATVGITGTTVAVNSKGNPVPERPLLKKPEWGAYHDEADGTKWTEGFFDQLRDKSLSDEYGFDTRNKEDNGIYKKPYLLKKGDLICRFGTPGGSYTTEFGEKYERCGLPYQEDTVEYHVYRVVAEEGILVYKGIVAPIFDSPGGAVQYHHAVRKIRDEIVLKRLVEVFDY